MLWICRSEIGGMAEDSEFEPCRVVVYVGAIPNGSQWKIVFNLKKMMSYETNDI